MGMLARVVEMVRPLEILFVDVTVIAQDVRVAPHRQAMAAGLASVLGVPGELVVVKATTTDHLGAIGSGEGLAAVAVVTARLR